MKGEKMTKVDTPARRWIGSGVAIAVLLAGISLVTRSRAAEPAVTNWAEYGGGAEGSQYSPLKQINKANVAQLEQVWFFAAPSNAGRFGFNPLVVDGTVYVLGANNTIVALDAV